MPKRSCPFADASPLQLKVHVGPRELSRGVFAERYSREVFERTKQLLFQGAQAYRDHILSKGCSIIHLPESLKPGLPGAPQATRGQMLIGPDGRLTRCQTQASSEAGNERLWIHSELRKIRFDQGRPPEKSPVGTDGPDV